VGDSFEGNDFEEASDRMTSIIESTTVSPKEKKAVLITFSGNIFLKNMTTVPVSVIHGDRILSQPFQSDEREVHPLPLDVLFTGHVCFLRMWG
jgi:co-chaperonin GroES (HSP10)